MRTQWWFVGLVAATCLVAGCSSKTASNTADENNPKRQASAANSTALEGATSPDSIAQAPMVLPPQPTQMVPVPNLIPPTASPERLPQVETGRPDPFSALVVPATVSVNRSQSASASAAPVAPPSPTVAVAPVPALPPLPPLQAAPTDVNQLPSLNLPTFTPPQPLAQTVEISGVVEVGGKTSVIVQVPNEQSSRYVHVGDYLGNGQVLVKRVEMGMEPVVILEEDGVEVTRYVGSGSSLAGVL
ncbi:MAG: hypothetical protein Kow00121_40100 [Elainellaceae cyanobacterium]